MVHHITIKVVPAERKRSTQKGGTRILYGGTRILEGGGRNYKLGLKGGMSARDFIHSMFGK